MEPLKHAAVVPLSEHGRLESQTATLEKCVPAPTERVSVHVHQELVLELVRHGRLRYRAEPLLQPSAIQVRHAPFQVREPRVHKLLGKVHQREPVRLGICFCRVIVPRQDTMGLSRGRETCRVRHQHETVSVKPSPVLLRLHAARGDSAPKHPRRFIIPLDVLGAIVVVPHISHVVHIGREQDVVVDIDLALSKHGQQLPARDGRQRRRQKPVELRNRRSHRTQIRRDVEVTHEPTAVQELVRRVCDRRVHRCVITRIRLGRTRGGRQIHVWLVGDGEPLGGGQGRVVGESQLRGGPLVAHFGGHHPRALFESQRGLQRFPIDDDAWLVVTVHGDFHVGELCGEDAEELCEGLGAPVVNTGENAHFAGYDGEAGDAGGT